MTETEYVISNFRERFLPFRDLRIVLHGSRDYAREIIRHFAGEFRFVGVMSRDELPGPEFCGLPVLREADLPSLEIDMIILTERVKYAEAVYQDLHRISEEKRILLYNMYGLNETDTHSSLEICYPLRPDEWRKLCGNYHLVAFEAMDTLLSGPMLILREQFRRLIVWLSSQGIEVRVSLRKSFPADRQIAALRASGLFPNLDEQLIVRQGEDLSFRRLREENPGKKILYIGNGLVNECLLPRCYGIDTYRFTEYYPGFGMPILMDDLAAVPYDSGRKEQLKQAIRESCVVSFDVFDTLLVRKTLCPEDVFGLTERRAAAMGYPADGFAAVRRDAQRTGGYGTIHDFYDSIRRHFAWSDELTQTMLGLELEVENEVIIPRTEVVELLDYAVSEGKTVVLVSDMYLPEPLFRDLLNRKGIRSFDRLFVSCDYRRSKRAGLFEDVCRLAPRPELILHFGDDYESDIQSASYFGIRTEQIVSAAVLAAARGWAKSIGTAETLTERCLVGMTVAELFRDPFQNPNLLERSMEVRLRRFAAGVIGPLTAGHMSWLLQKLSERDYDGVLFLSRDGYLPIHLYRGLMRDFSLPRPIYYYANRHSTFLCCADDPSRIPVVLHRGEYLGLDVDHLLTNIYNLPEEALLPHAEGESASDYILRHMPVIREKAEAARAANRLYAERCGIKPDGNYAVVDFISIGNTQDYMKSILSCRLDGFYFGNYAPGERERLRIERIEDYLLFENRILVTNFLEPEGFFSSPEPAVDHIAEDGSVVFEDEPRTAEELQEFSLVFSAALDYAKEFFRLFYQAGESVCPKLPEEMFAAEGYHGVQRSIYDDWPKAKIPVRKWHDEKGVL